MNPIIEKDLRTTARSMRFFRFIMIFLLIASILLIWLLSLKRDYSRSGHDNVLVVMFCVQAACLALAIPAFACTAINGERERRTFDLLRISALKPSQIIRGKFFAIMIYLGVFIIAFLPVMAACSLFGGINLPRVLLQYGHLALYAGALAALCLMLSAGVDGTVKSILIGYVLMLVAAFYWLRGGLLFWMSYGPNLPFSVPIAFYISTFVEPVLLGSFFYLAAVSLLKPPSWNRSTALRIWFAVYMMWPVVLSAVYLAEIGAGLAQPSFSFRMSSMQTYALQALLAAVAFCGEPSRLPQRLADRARRAHWWTWLFLPGRNSALVFVPLVCLVSSVAATAATHFYMAKAQEWDSTSMRQLLYVNIEGFAYILFCCLVAACTRYIWDSRRSRVAAVAALLIFALAPLAGVLADSTIAKASPFLRLVPGLRWSSQAAGTGIEVFLGYHLAAALIVVLVTARVRRRRKELQEAAGLARLIRRRANRSHLIFRSDPFRKTAFAQRRLLHRRRPARHEFRLHRCTGRRACNREAVRIGFGTGTILCGRRPPCDGEIN